MFKPPIVTILICGSIGSLMSSHEEIPNKEYSFQTHHISVPVPEPTSKEGYVPDETPTLDTLCNSQSGSPDNLDRQSGLLQKDLTREGFTLPQSLNASRATQSGLLQKDLTREGFTPPQSLNESGATAKDLNSSIINAITNFDLLYQNTLQHELLLLELEKLEITDDSNLTNSTSEHIEAIKTDMQKRVKDVVRDPLRSRAVHNAVEEACNIMHRTINSYIIERIQILLLKNSNFNRTAKKFIYNLTWLKKICNAQYLGKPLVNLSISAFKNLSKELFVELEDLSGIDYNTYISLIATKLQRDIKSSIKELATRCGAGKGVIQVLYLLSEKIVSSFKEKIENVEYTCTLFHDEVNRAIKNSIEKMELIIQELYETLELYTSKTKIPPNELDELKKNAIQYAYSLIDSAKAQVAWEDYMGEIDPYQPDVGNRTEISEDDTNRQEVQRGIENIKSKDMDLANEQKSKYLSSLEEIQSLLSSVLPCNLTSGYEISKEKLDLVVSEVSWIISSFKYAMIQGKPTSFYENLSDYLHTGCRQIENDTVIETGKLLIDYDRMIFKNNSTAFLPALYSYIEYLFKAITKDELTLN